MRLVQHNARKVLQCTNMIVTQGLELLLFFDRIKFSFQRFQGRFVFGTANFLELTCGDALDGLVS